MSSVNNAIYYLQKPLPPSAVSLATVVSRTCSSLQALELAYNALIIPLMPTGLPGRWSKSYGFLGEEKKKMTRGIPSPKCLRRRVMTKWYSWTLSKVGAPNWCALPGFAHSSVALTRLLTGCRLAGHQPGKLESSKARRPIVSSVMGTCTSSIRQVTRPYTEEKSDKHGSSNASCLVRVSAKKSRSQHLQLSHAGSRLRRTDVVCIRVVTGENCICLSPIAYLARTLSAPYDVIVLAGPQSAKGSPDPWAESVWCCRLRDNEMFLLLCAYVRTKVGINSKFITYLPIKSSNSRKTAHSSET